MNAPPEYFQAGFFDFTPVSDLDLCAQIPGFTCPSCGQSLITSWLSYPNLDVLEIVSKEERKRLGPVMRLKSSDEEIIRIISRLRDRWAVPITAGTVVGPTRVKVTSKPKDDFHVLPNHIGFFCRRPAAKRLLQEGVPIQFVETPAKGKYGAEADYVEIVVPVMGRVQLPIEKTFCDHCLRYSPGKSFPTVLLREHTPLDQPFFKTLENGVMIFSSEFIRIARQLGITGFVEGKTLLPVEVVGKSSPRPSLFQIEAEAALVRERKWKELLEETERNRKKV